MRFLLWLENFYLFFFLPFLSFSPSILQRSRVFLTCDLISGPITHVNRLPIPIIPFLQSSPGGFAWDQNCYCLTQKKNKVSWKGLKFTVLSLNCLDSPGLGSSSCTLYVGSELWLLLKLQLPLHQFFSPLCVFSAIVYFTLASLTIMSLFSRNLSKCLSHQNYSFLIASAVKLYSKNNDNNNNKNQPDKQTHKTKNKKRNSEETHY